jgi:hypothetical protein
MTKDAHIRWKQLLETTRRKPLSIILTFAGTQMLLVDAIVVVAKLVH